MVSFCDASDYHRELARPTQIRRSKFAEAVRELRAHLGETQQQFAGRLGTSVVTVAKYETDMSRPGAATLARLAQISAENNLPDLALKFRKEFIPYLKLSPEEQRRADIMSKVLNSVPTLDVRALEVIEQALEPTLPTGSLFSLAKPRDKRQHLPSFEANLQPAPSGNSELQAVAWLLEVEEERKALRRYLVDAITRVIEEREAELTEQEQGELAELGQEAVSKLAAERERDKRAADLSVPAAIEGFRNELALTEPEFARKIGVSTNELADFESGVRGPSPRILGRMIDLYQGGFDQRSAEYQVLLSAIRKRFVSGSRHAAAGASETFSGGIGWRTYDAMFQIIKDLIRERNKLRRQLAEYSLPRTSAEPTEGKPGRKERLT